MIDPAQLGAMTEAIQPALGGPPAAPPPMPPGPPALPGGEPPMAPPPVDPAALGMAPPEEPKKPPLLLPPRLARQLAQGYVDQARTMARQVADFTGPPDDFTRMPLKAQVQAWYKRDARQDPYALKEQGLSDVEIRDKVYPLRRVLLKMAGPRPADRAAFARKMKEERARTDMLQGEAPST